MPATSWCFVVFNVAVQYSSVFSITFSLHTLLDGFVLLRHHSFPGDPILFVLFLSHATIGRRSLIPRKSGLLGASDN